MPTPSEQKALAFVAIVILLAGAVRVVRAGAPPEPTSQEQQALARQATAVDSAASASRGRKPGRSIRLRKPKPGAKPEVVGGVSTVPFASMNGFPPPSPRIDIDFRSPADVAPALTHRSGKSTIDLDQATEQQIDALPYVGPALARRIVASRDSLGPFGSLEALRRVKGIGPATLERLVPLVTFSGRPSSRP